MRIISLTGATSVLDPVHGEHHAGPDGVFELPQHFADHLLKTAAGSFRGEADHLSQLAREAFDQLRDPRVALQALSDLLGRMEALEARVTELEAAPVAVGGAPEVDSEPKSEVEDDDLDGTEGGETPEELGDPEPEAGPEPEEALKPTTKRRPGTDRPPRTRPASKNQA